MATKVNRVRRRSSRVNPRALIHKHQSKERAALIKERVNLYKRALRIPPTINQFNNVLDEETTDSVFSLLMNFVPETRKEKRLRLIKEKENGRVGPKPLLNKFGIKHVTNLIEEKKAKLVLIADDVDPIEVVIFLPSLCKKMNVPYAIAHGKKRLGELVNLKSATCVCICDMKPEYMGKFNEIVSHINSQFISDFENAMSMWGGGATDRESIKGDGGSPVRA